MYKTGLLLRFLSSGICNGEKKKKIIQVYAKPDGTQVVRAFTLKDFIWYDEDGMIVSLDTVLSNRLLAAQMGHHYEIQKNRMNNQIVKQNWDKDCPQLCAIGSSLDIVELAMKCGAKEGTTVYLTGNMITKYYRHITQLVFPSISDEELRLFS